jgi:hypothetical protein
VSCALEPDVEAVITVQGREHRFRGGEALAPAWAERPMSDSEQRWVSACLLARTNAFGERVPVYLHSGAGPVAEPARARDGAGEFRLFEGMFFGNVFAEPPQAFACHGPANTAALAAGVLSRRACARPLEAHGPSACGFVVTGACDAPGALRAAGREWTEVMQVWLRAD